MIGARALILEKLMPPLYWLILVAAGWVLLRGHNEPGGGFIGGLVALSATAAYAIALGVDAARRRMPLAPLRLAIVGVALALGSGLPAVLVGKPYLTHLWFDLPLGFAELSLSTVLLFDAGVFCAVWGTLAGYAFALLRGIASAPGDAS